MCDGATDCKTAQTMIDSVYNPLSYVDRLDRRSLKDVEMVVVHATELPDLATARQYGERIRYEKSGTGDSGHFYIDRDGTVQMWVAPDRVAHHVRGHNTRSIGIELVNRGRWPNWLDSRQQDWQESYESQQIEALVMLVHKLRLELPGLRFIAGHDELDTGLVNATDNPAVKIRRKVDPGPAFPWAEVEASLGLERIGTRID